MVSISTLEYVGWDEVPKHPEKVIKAIDSLKSLLKPNGLLFVTFPFGYNEFIDKKISQGKFPFNELKFLKRISKDNKWIEVGYGQAKSCEYGTPYKNGNGMLFAYYKNGNNKYFDPKS